MTVKLDTSPWAFTLNNALALKSLPETENIKVAEFGLFGAGIETKYPGSLFSAKFAEEVSAGCQRTRSCARQKEFRQTEKNARQKKCLGDIEKMNALDNSVAEDSRMNNDATTKPNSFLVILWQHSVLLMQAFLQLID